MKITVLVQDYPSPTNVATMAFVHSRNLWYVAHGVDVTVASFECRKPYEFEGITVVPAGPAVVQAAELVVAHAPNVRNHVRVLRNCNRPVVFFFHGFEVLRTNRYYPRPFDFQRHWSDPLRSAATACYDHVKLKVLDRVLARKREQGGSFVFVSEWMRDEFIRNLRHGADIIAGRDHIIPNAVHEAFVGVRYEPPAAPTADFVTFRSNVDQPKYAVDVVVDLARANPDMSFHVFGRGQLLQRLDAPSNVTHHDVTVPQAELPARAAEYRCALIPSRLDAQGVTACEMATFGIPTIVSDLPVARAVLGEFANVGFLSERGTVLPDLLADLVADLPSGAGGAQRTDFLPDTTCAREVDVFARTLRGNDA